MEYTYEGGSLHIKFVRILLDYLGFERMREVKFGEQVMEAKIKSEGGKSNLCLLVFSTVEHPRSKEEVVAEEVFRKNIIKKGTEAGAFDKERFNHFYKKLLHDLSSKYHPKPFLPPK